MVGCVALLCFVSPGCTLKATFKQTTDTTSNITGTTSGRAWFTEDGQFRPEWRSVAFVRFNRENLLQDVARAQGEYLASLQQLLSIPPAQQSGFVSRLQASYQPLTRSGIPSEEAFLAELKQAALDSSAR